MLIAFDVVAGRKKVLPEDDDPVQESMRGDRKLLANPSTDQKKVRRRQQKTSDLTTESGVRDWYDNRRRAPKEEMPPCEICEHGDSCPTCGYQPKKTSVLQQRFADVSATGEDSNVR